MSYPIASRLRTTRRRVPNAARFFPVPVTTAPIRFLSSRVAPKKNGRPARARFFDRAKPTYTLDVRGRHRVFDDAEYRFYRSHSAPPEEGDTPYATSSSLPATPADTFSDGTWYISVSHFNGVLDSGFLPIGRNGETYRKAVISGGALQATTPPAPGIHLEPVAAGARLFANVILDEDGETYEWAVAATTNGSTPASDAPGYTAAAEGAAVYARDFSSLADGTVLKVVVQIRRNDGTVGSPVWVYSDAVRAELTIDAAGPAAPPYLDLF